MKKICLVLCLAVVLVGCKKASTTPSAATPTPEPTVTATPAPEVGECKSGKHLRGVGPDGGFCFECVDGKWKPCKEGK